MDIDKLNQLVSTPYFSLQESPFMAIREMENLQYIAVKDKEISQ